MDEKSPYDRLLDEICVGLGFCGDVIDGRPTHVDDYIPDSGTVGVEQFVDWVLLAEGMDLNEADALKYRDCLREAFIRHMGSDQVDAKRLGWRFK